MPAAIGARVIARGAILVLALCLVAGEAGAKARHRRHVAIAGTPVTTVIRAARPAPARFFTINSVLAKLQGLPGATAAVRLAALDTAASVSDAGAPAREAESDQPFGLFMFRAPEGALWVKWHGVEADLAREAETIASCRADRAQCRSAAALRFIAMVDAARALDGRARIEAVNRAVNLAVRYMTDWEQHGVADLWSAPLATLTTGLGDYEDYAIAKYAVLRDAGTPPESLRILLVRDTAVHADHAVVAVRDEGRWLILDNRSMLLTEDRQSTHLMPLFAIDSQGVKLLAAPYARHFETEDVAPATAQWGEDPAETPPPASAYAGRSALPLLM